jgi:hypothetical protein
MYEKNYQQRKKSIAKGRGRDNAGKKQATCGRDRDMMITIDRCILDSLTTCVDRVKKHACTHVSTYARTYVRTHARRTHLGSRDDVSWYFYTMSPTDVLMPKKQTGNLNGVERKIMNIYTGN